MDDPESDPVLLINTVKQFRLINFFLTGSRKLIKKHFISKMVPGSGRVYTVLDAGAGGCDTALWMVKYCKKKIFVYR
jgi:ubiquinone/menaquinone biosynthesis C-methylase UbiE